MSNPYLVRVPFAINGSKNTIQITRQPSQDPEDATYDTGFPPETMIPTDAGGLAPKGLDFNGIFYELSSPIAHYCRGDRIQFDATYAAAIGGYSKGAILASDDYQKDYISLIDNNTANPNGTNTTWAVYAGQGSIPVATSTTTGTVKLVNSLNSNATDAALTAAQGQVLNNIKLNTNQALGVDQTWKNLTGSRSIGSLYSNNTTKPILVNLCFPDTNSGTPRVIVNVNGVEIININYDNGTNFGAAFISFIVPSFQTYRVDVQNTSVNPNVWAELS